jgi:hypothetical protein
MSKKTPYQYLRIKYPESEYVLIKEIADSNRRNRYLDFMVVNLWESRGLSVTGIEVKSYRSDWLNELKNPAKQELHVPYCDYFYLFTTDENVAKLEEIPENWGWMTIKGDKIFTLKKAPKLDAKPIPKQLMIAMLRRAADKTEFIHQDSIKDEIQRKIDYAIEQQKRNRDRELERCKELTASVVAFEEASGLKIDRYSFSGSSKMLGEKVRFVMKYDLEDMLGSLRLFNQHIKNLAEKSEDAINQLNQIK